MAVNWWRSMTSRLQSCCCAKFAAKRQWVHSEPGNTCLATAAGKRKTPPKACCENQAAMCAPRRSCSMQVKEHRKKSRILLVIQVVCAISLVILQCTLHTAPPLLYEMCAPEKANLSTCQLVNKQEHQLDRRWVLQPTVSRRDVRSSWEWRIRNLPYPVGVYQVTIEARQVVVRTTNKKCAAANRKRCLYRHTPAPPLVDSCCSVLPACWAASSLP